MGSESLNINKFTDSIYDQAEVEVNQSPSKLHKIKSGDQKIPIIYKVPIITIEYDQKHKINESENNEFYERLFKQISKENKRHLSAKSDSNGELYSLKNNMKYNNDKSLPFPNYPTSQALDPNSKKNSKKIIRSEFKLKSAGDVKKVNFSDKGLIKTEIREKNEEYCCNDKPLYFLNSFKSSKKSPQKHKKDTTTDLPPIMKLESNKSLIKLMSGFKVEQPKSILYRQNTNKDISKAEEIRRTTQNEKTNQSRSVSKKRSLFCCIPIFC